MIRDLLAAYLGGALVDLLRSSARMFEALDKTRLPERYTSHVPKWIVSASMVIGFMGGATVDAVLWPIRLPFLLYRRSSKIHPTDTEIVAAAATYFTALYGRMVASSIREEMIVSSHEELIRCLLHRFQNRNSDIEMRIMFDIDSKEEKQ